MGQAEGPTEVDGPDIQRQEIGGIPTFVSRPAPHYTGALVFRVGRADETLRHGGLTHLVEHLALHWVGSSPPYGFNGAVTGLYTIFHATGTPEQVADFLGRVARALHDLPLERLDKEARVLMTESAQMALGWYPEMLWLRFGASTHGLAMYKEFELYSPSPDRVRAWAAERFTAGNAALWFTGPPPATLDLTLPAGARQPPPVLRQVPNLLTPSAATWGNPGVGICFLHPRADWMSIPMGIVANRLMTRLRFDRAIAYDIKGHYEPLDTQSAAAALWGASLPEHHAEIRDVVISTFEEFAAKGPTEEELAEMKVRVSKDLQDTRDAHGRLMAEAISELLDRKPLNRVELLRELDALTETELARRVAAAMESALLLSPHRLPSPPPRFHPYPNVSLDVVAGRSFRPTNTRFPWSKGPRLVVGPSGVSIFHPQSPPVTVKYDALAAALWHPDGTYELIGEDGFRIEVSPQHWRHGHAAVVAIAAAIPEDRVATVAPEKPDGGPPP